jgi:hypothetical protein
MEAHVCRGIKWNKNYVLRYKHKPTFLETEYTAAGMLTLSICPHYEPRSYHTPGCKGAACTHMCRKTVI